MIEEENKLLISDGDDLYINKSDGSILPVNHPDLSTQPSILPERFGKFKINEVLVQISGYNDLTDKKISYIDTECAGIYEGEFIYGGAEIIGATFIGEGICITPFKVIRTDNLWRFYFDTSYIGRLRYCIVKYYYV